MIRFAIPPIGGADWFGGWMYMRNLVKSLALFGDRRIELFVFVGPDRAEDAIIGELAALPRTHVIADPAFAQDKMRTGTLATLLTGRRAHLVDAFERAGIDVALDWATYYGWHNPIPTVAWLPDFQHRALPHMFSARARLQREVGFRAQIAASEKILLSSFAAEHDCLEMYPGARGKTQVARFSVPTDDWPDANSAIKRLRDAGMPEEFVFLPNQLWFHKNHRLAIEAAGLLAKQGSRRVIIATGRGEDTRRPGYRQELLDLIERSGAAANFRLLDGVDHDMVRAMTVGAMGLLNPSRFEGWSTTVEEAKAVGTPLVLSDITVHREQAPEARFFGVDDAAALAAHLDALSSRGEEAIASAMMTAKAHNLIAQRAFAASIGTAVLEAMADGTGKQAR